MAGIKLPNPDLVSAFRDRLAMYSQQRYDHTAALTAQGPRFSPSDMKTIAAYRAKQSGKLLGNIEKRGKSGGSHGFFSDLAHEAGAVANYVGEKAGAALHVPGDAARAVMNEAGHAAGWGLSRVPGVDTAQWQNLIGADQTSAPSWGRLTGNIDQGYGGSKYLQNAGVQQYKGVGGIAQGIAADTVSDPTILVGPGEGLAGGAKGVAGKIAEDGGPEFAAWMKAGGLVDKAATAGGSAANAAHAARAAAITKVLRSGTSSLGRADSKLYLGGTRGAKLLGNQKLTVLPQEATDLLLRPANVAGRALRRTGDLGKAGDALSGVVAKDLGPALRSGDPSRAVPALLMSRKSATEGSWVNAVAQNEHAAFADATKGIGKDEKANLFRALQGDSAAAAQLSDKGVAAAHSIRNTFETLYAHAKNAGVDLGHQESYLPGYRNEDFAQHLADNGLEAATGRGAKAAAADFTKSRYKWGDEFAGKVLTPKNGDTSPQALHDQMDELLGTAKGGADSIFNNNLDQVVPRAIDVMTRRIGQARIEQSLTRAGVIRPTMEPFQVAEVVANPLAHEPQDVADAVLTGRDARVAASKVGDARVAAAQKVADDQAAVNRARRVAASVAAGPSENGSGALGATGTAESALPSNPAESDAVDKLVQGSGTHVGAADSTTVPPPTPSTVPNQITPELHDLLSTAPDALAAATGGRVIRTGDHVLINIPDAHALTDETAIQRGVDKATGLGVSPTDPARRAEYVAAAQQTPEHEAIQAAVQDLQAKLAHVEQETGVHIPIGEDSVRKVLPAKNGRPQTVLTGHNFIIDMSPWTKAREAAARATVEVHPQAAALDANDPSVALGLFQSADPMQYATQQYIAASLRGDEQTANMWKAAVNETDPHLKQMATLEAQAGDAANHLAAAPSVFEKAVAGDARAVKSASNGMRVAITRGMRTMMNDPNMMAPKDVANALETMGKAYEPNGVETFLTKYMAPVVQWQKTWEVASPRFQIKTAIGNVFQNWLKGVDVNSYSLYSRLSKAAAEHYSAEAAAAPAGTGALWGALSSSEKEWATALHEHDLLGPFSQSFLRSDTGKSDLATGFKKWNPLGSQGPISRTGVALGTDHVAFGRGAMFVDTLKKGGSVDDAVGLIDKFHFNYTDVSRTESNIKRFIPFYTFTRHNLPLQVEMLAMHPGKMRLWNILKSNLEQQGTPDHNVPDYFNQGPFPNARTPLQAGGGSLYLKNLSPEFELNQWSNDPVGSAEGMVTPIIKTPLEHALGHRLDPVGSYPLNHKDVPMPTSFAVIPGMTEALSVLGGAHQVRGKWMVGSDVVDDVSNNLPILGQAKRLVPGDDVKGQRNLLGAFLSWSTGALATNTLAQQQHTLDSKEYAKAYSALNYLKGLPYNKSTFGQIKKEKKLVGNQIGKIKAGRGPQVSQG